MLYRNLIYTGLTRAKTLAVFVGTRKALAMAIRQQDVSQRQTALATCLKLKASELDRLLVFTREIVLSTITRLDLSSGIVAA